MASPLERMARLAAAGFGAATLTVQAEAQEPECVPRLHPRIESQAVVLGFAGAGTMYIPVDTNVAAEDILNGETNRRVHVQRERPTDASYVVEIDVNDRSAITDMRVMSITGEQLSEGCLDGKVILREEENS